MFERQWIVTEQSTAVLDSLRAAQRHENQAAGARLAAIGELDVLRSREHRQIAETEWFSVDTEVAVSAEVAAALSISEGLAAGYLHDARAFRARLPRVGALLLAGEISY